MANFSTGRFNALVNLRWKRRLEGANIGHENAEDMA